MNRSTPSEPRRRAVAVAYDIVDDRCRERVANALPDFEVRVQYSVFECSLSRVERRRLLKKLDVLIDPAEDAVSLYPQYVIL